MLNTQRAVAGLREKLSGKAGRIVSAISALAGAGIAAAGNVCAASVNITQMIQDIVGWAGKLLIIPAVVCVVIGFVQLGMAKTDGDGPAKKKAIDFLVGGFMTAILAAIFLLPATGTAIAGWFTTD